MIKNKIVTLLLSVVMLLAVGLAGCESEGPVEKAGKKIDEAMESIKETAQEATDKDGPAEKAGEKLDEALDQVKQ
jgi:ABC-type transporter MlaC component